MFGIDILRRAIPIDSLCVEFDQPAPAWTTGAMLRQLDSHDYILQKVDDWNLVFAHRRVLEP